MAKRFTDTEKWVKAWYRKLPPSMKLFWHYLCDNCNHAGIWEVDMELAEFQLGETVDMETVKQWLGHKIKEVSIDKWHIPSFVEFQYGDLNPKNKAHLSVMNILKRYNLLGASEGLVSPLEGAKDKDKELDKDMDKEKDKEELGTSEDYKQFAETRKMLEQKQNIP